MSLSVQDSLSVWWNARHAGEISIDGGGAMHFAYALEWLTDPGTPPLSQALPKQVGPFGDALCKAVFGGLLPEEAQRTAIARALGVHRTIRFVCCRRWEETWRARCRTCPLARRLHNRTGRTAPQPSTSPNSLR